MFIKVGRHVYDLLLTSRHSPLSKSDRKQTYRRKRPGPGRTFPLTRRRGGRMGKTKPTYRNRVQEHRSDWRRMRKYLRKHQKPAYDRLWEHADNLSDATGQANPRDTMNGVLLSICLGQQLDIERLEERLEDLDN